MAFKRSAVRSRLPPPTFIPFCLSFVFLGSASSVFLIKGKASVGFKELAFFTIRRGFFFCRLGCFMADTENTAAVMAASVGKPVADETILKVVKFIEVGRLSPANFNETFQDVYRSVRDAVRS